MVGPEAPRPVILGAIGPLKKRLPTTNRRPSNCCETTNSRGNPYKFVDSSRASRAGKPVSRGRRLVHASLRLRVASCASIASVHSLATFVLVCWMVLGCTGGSGFESCSRRTPVSHHVVYHVDFHGATIHMEIHVVNHGRKTTW